MTILFDLDGTLVDSAHEIVSAMEHAWTCVIPELPFPRERFVIGPPLTDAILAMSPAIDREKAAELAVAFRARYDASDFSATVPYPGVLDAIATLVAEGVTLGIATNKRSLPTRRILARWFDGRFDRVACVDGAWTSDERVVAENPWPKAGIAAKIAMLEWHVERERSQTLGEAAHPSRTIVMIGDSASDIAAARAVRARAIAVTWGYGTRESLASESPDAIVDDVPSLMTALREMRVPG